MSDEAKSVAAVLSILFCGSWLLFGNQFALVVLGLATVVILYVIAERLRNMLPDRIIDAIERQTNDRHIELMNALKHVLPDRIIDAIERQTNDRHIELMNALKGIQTAIVATE